MNTRLIMTASAFLLALIGLGLTFTGAELAASLAIGATPILQLFLQLLGALYVAFALLNWMARGAVMGGIYNRPIAIANLAHFLVGALALVKALVSHPELPGVLWVLAGFYCLFALLFGAVFFRAPVSRPGATAIH